MCYVGAAAATNLVNTVQCLELRTAERRTDCMLHFIMALDALAAWYYMQAGLIHQLYSRTLHTRQLLSWSFSKRCGTYSVCMKSKEGRGDTVGDAQRDPDAY